MNCARRYFVSLEELEQYHDKIEQLLDTSSLLQSKLLNRRTGSITDMEIVERQSLFVNMQLNSFFRPSKNLITFNNK